ncbi:diguanylate cyclase domain-containing protein [Planctomycetaceae bacterium SH139]
MFIDILVAISCGLAGMLCGWLAYPSLIMPPPQTSSPPRAEATPQALAPVQAAQPDNQLEKARLEQITLRLRTLTENTAAGVDTHQLQVQSLTESLKEVDLVRHPDAIFAAMNRLLDASDTLRVQLSEAQSRFEEQSMLLQSAQQQAVTDQLTQIANRRALDDYMHDLMRRQPPQPSTLMLLDIDHFKKFNDAYGHLTGDEVLKRVAKHIEHRIGAHGMVARYGGEEFAVVFGDTTMVDCRALAEQTRASIADREIVFEGQHLRVTSSSGLAEWTGCETVDEWIARADAALYESKANERNCGYAQLGDTMERLTPRGEPTSAAPPRPLSEAEKLEAEITRLLPQEPNFSGLPRCLQGLPIGSRLIREFSEFATNVQASGAIFVTAMVRIDHHSAGQAAPLGQAATAQGQPDFEDLRMVARTIRSVVRAVDRIGLLDAKTILIGMPSLSPEGAVTRAERIRTGVNYASDGASEFRQAQKSVTVALANSHQAADFPQMLNLCLDMLADQPLHSADQTLACWEKTDF